MLKYPSLYKGLTHFEGIFMLLNPEVFGMEHIVFLVVFLIIGVGSLILAKLKFKTEKSQWIYMRVLAALTIAFNILTRIGVGIDHNRWMDVIPNTFCSLTGFLFPLAVLFGKKDLKVFHGLWYMAFVGGIASIIYADFIGQAATIWHINTIGALLYHGIMFILSVATGMFKVFRPSLKKSHWFPLVTCVYIALGAIELNYLGFNNAMCIRSALIGGTPLYCWFILLVGTALVYLAAFLYEYFPKLISKIKSKKAQSKQ